MALHKRKGLGVKPHVLITPALSMCVGGGGCMYGCGMETGGLLGLARCQPSFRTSERLKGIMWRVSRMPDIFLRPPCMYMGVSTHVCMQTIHIPHKQIHK